MVALLDEPQADPAPINALLIAERADCLVAPTIPYGDTLELGSGESMVIGGLLKNNQNNSISKAPFLGDIPIIGTLFRSNNFQRNETELVIVVTPYLVKPVNANQIALPTDGYRTPNDAARILGGQLASGRSGVGRPVPRALPSAPAVPAGQRGSAGIRPSTPSAAPGFSF